MNQEWVSLESAGFPAYDLSNDGLVRNRRTGRILRLSKNQEGIVRVGLMKPDENKQITVSLVRLVARMFVPGRSIAFNTPIQLNGRRDDCRADNIMWRPRWFAIRYFNQFEETEEPLFRAKIIDVETSREYDDSREAASANGLLEENILKSVSTGAPCFPTWQIFARKTQ